MQNIYFVIILQLLLVSGGYTGSEYTSATELFNGMMWLNVGKLPWGMVGIKIINIDNRILTFGKGRLKKTTKKM